MNWAARVLRIAVVLLALGGCGADRSDPAAVLLAYLEAVAGNDLEAAYAHLSGDDRAFRTLKGYIALESVGDSVIVRKLARQTRVRILSLEIEGERALARVRVARPDMAQALGIAMQGIFSGGASFEDAAERALGAPLPLVESDERYVLVREADGWRVRLGWRHQSEIDAYVAAAQLHAREGGIDTAIELYRKALALDGARIDLERRIAALESPPGEEATGEPGPLRDIPDIPGESPLARARRNRARLRELVHDELEDLGAPPGTLESAERAPYLEGP
jgi:hypothetical protein